jgi:hypothetical protein
LIQRASGMIVSPSNSSRSGRCVRIASMNDRLA